MQRLFLRGSLPGRRRSASRVQEVKRNFDMQKNDETENEMLKTQCLALEEQVKLLVKTELTLRRTQAELIQSKEKIEDYNRTLEQKVEERTRELLQSNEKLKIEMIEREKAEEEKKKLQESLSRAAKMEAVGILPAVWRTILTIFLTVSSVIPSCCCERFLRIVL